MPTVLRIGPARFFFYYNEGSEPPHVHVEQAGAVAKFWLEPVCWHHQVGSPREFFVGWSDRSANTGSSSSRRGMTTSEPRVDPRATNVEVTDDELSVDLVDGRRVIVPLAWFPRLLHATAAQRSNWRLLGDGEGVHWPDIDEDLSVGGLLRGTASPGASRRAV